MSSQQAQTQGAQQQPRKSPALLRKLVGMIYSDARELGSPKTFNGVIFVHASANEPSEQGDINYRIEIRDSANGLSPSQLSRIHAIINETASPTSTHKPRKPRARKGKQSQEPAETTEATSEQPPAAPATPEQQADKPYF